MQAGAYGVPKMRLLLAVTSPARGRANQNGMPALTDRRAGVCASLPKNAACVFTFGRMEVVA